MHDLLKLANETSEMAVAASNKFEFHQIKEEEICQKPSEVDRKGTDKKTYSEEIEEFIPKMNFTLIQKVNHKPQHVHIVHNDLDLKDLQKSFIRKKNVKFQKVKTEEHSDSESSYSSDSSDSDDDIVIPQGTLVFFIRFNRYNTKKCY